MHTTFMRPNKRNVRRTLHVLCIQNNAKCLCLSDGHCLKNVNLTVIPPTVRKGSHASLLCQYDLEGAPLYSVKWYRGNFEFYRYSPGEKPAFKIFPYNGIYVDVSIKAKILTWWTEHFQQFSWFCFHSLNDYFQETQFSSYFFSY